MARAAEGVHWISQDGRGDYEPVSPAAASFSKYSARHSSANLASSSALGAFFSASCD